MNKIQNRWYSLLDKTKLPDSDQSGETAVTFKVYPDGKINSLEVIKNTGSAPEFLAMQAIKDCTPFPKWPNNMQHAVNLQGKDYIEINFSFDYFSITNPAIAK